MREFKFRAWHPVMKRMHYDAIVNGSSWTDRSTHYCGEADTLMQYTGLKDKNGKEIYEGDILLADYDYCEHENVYLEVKWDDSRASFYLMDISDDVAEDNDEFDLINQCYQVIGNIYETPDLLK